MIYYYNNVPNNTSIFEHWSVLTVYWQWWFEETGKRHIKIWINVISAQFSKTLCSILHVCRRLEIKNPTGFLIFFIIRQQMCDLFLHLLANSVLVMTTVAAIFRVWRILTSVENTTHYKVRHFQVLSFLPEEPRKNTNLVPLIQSKKPHERRQLYKKKCFFKSLHLRGRLKLFRYCIKRGNSLHIPPLGTHRL